MTQSRLQSRQAVRTHFGSVANPFQSSGHRSAGVTGRQDDVLSYFTFADTDTATPHAKYCLAMALIESYNSSPESDLKPPAVAAYIITVTNLLFPGFVDEISRSRDLTLKEVKDSYSVWNIVPEDNLPKKKKDVQKGKEKEKGGEEKASDAGNEDEQQDETEYSFQVSADPSEETLGFGVLNIGDLFGILSPEIVGGRWGIEMFPIGKTPSTRNITAFTVNRPRAIQGKYNLSTEGASFFSETYAPKLTHLKAIETCFNVYPVFRKQCGTEWVQWTFQSASRMKNAFSVTFQLTDSAGFSSAHYINKLLLDHPLLASLPLLKTEILAYKEALSEFLRMDPRVRGFSKVIHGGNFALFRASSRGALLALAVVHARMSNPTMASFLETSDYSSLLNRANEFLLSNDADPIAVESDDNVTQQIETHTEA